MIYLNHTEAELIAIKVYRNRDSTVRVRVSGHGGGKKGEDIVCSAVSAVTQTALAGLLYYGKNLIKWKKKDGLLDIAISDTQDQELFSVFKTILFTMVLGLKGIVEEYPKIVKLDVGKDFDI
jgi:uncharacterized protein YsxB (DUF464 family)